jgi:hypothetical protein
MAGGLGSVVDSTSPARIGDHEVLGLLATGGMSEIFLGRDPSHRPVVIKRILPHLARQPNFVSMFIDEARFGSSIRHPNVVAVSELGRTENDLFMVMEYVEGESALGLLRRLVGRRQKLAYGLAAYIVAEACKGLHAAHELRDDDGNLVGLIHRDVSPHNVFVGYDGSVKVLDFGIATGAHRLANTATGQLKGKFLYMSPEQCRGEPLDLRSDIFSLGIVLYELSMHRQLFSRPSELMVLKAVCDDPIPSPSQLVRDYPEFLEDICLRALSRDRELRYGSAMALHDDLVAVQQMLFGMGADPKRELAREMQRLFAERIEEKRRMLDDANAGVALGVLPSPEVDEGVNVPNAIQNVATPTAFVVPLPPPAPVRPARTLARWQKIALAVAAVIVLGTIIGFAIPDGDPASSAQASAAPATTVDDLVSGAPAPAPAPPAHAGDVTIRIETRPDGATVLVDGEELGTSPIDVRIAGNAAAQIEIRRRGYKTEVQQITGDRDQTIVVPLSKKRESRRKPKRGFRRFD